MHFTVGGGGDEHRVVRRFPGFTRLSFDRGGMKVKTLGWLEAVP
jgi:hypothetical protein